MTNKTKATLGAVLTAALALLLGTSGASAKRPRAQQPTGNATRGKALYLAHGCYSCHGYNGEARTGADLTRPVGILASETAFVAFLRMRANLAPLLPSAQMPNFSKADLSDKDANDIYAYIRTFTPDSPALKDVPVLQSILNGAKNEPTQ